MKLIFFLQRNSWYVSHANGWSSLQDQKDIKLALSVLPLESVDEFELNEQPVQFGTATFSLVNKDTVKVSLFANDGSLAEEHELALDYERLSSVDWQDPPHDDNWMNSVVQLKLENVRRLSLKIYIPPSADSDGKSLVIRDNVSGEENSIFLHRGEENECVVVNAPEACDHRLTLRCDAEAANDSADVRSLGFVLLDKAVEV